MSAKIAQALHQVMSAVGYVQKTGKNAFHGYKYAGEADLLEKLRPAMIEAGLILIPSVDSVSEIDEHGNTHVRVAYTLAHKDGEIWPEKIYAAGTGGDRAKNGSVGDKGTYKAITGANKYLLFKLFQIETGDDPETASPEQYAPAGNGRSSRTREQISADKQSREKTHDDFERELAEVETLVGLARFEREWAPKLQGEGGHIWTMQEKLERRRQELSAPVEDEQPDADGVLSEPDPNLHAMNRLKNALSACQDEAEIDRIKASDKFKADFKALPSGLQAQVLAHGSSIRSRFNPKRGSAKPTGVELLAAG